MLIINHKNATSQLVSHDLDSRKLLRDLLEELRKLHYYRLEVSISQVLAIDSIAFYNPFWIHMSKIWQDFSKKVDHCLLINFSKIFDW